MTEQNKDTEAPATLPPQARPPEPPGPTRLVISELPFESCNGPRYKWHMERDGMVLAIGAGDHPTEWDATQAAALTSLHILDHLSTSYCRLAADVSKTVQAAKAEQARRAKAHTDGTPEPHPTGHPQDGGVMPFASSDSEEESEEELSERARLDAEAEAPDIEAELDQALEGRGR